MKTVNVIYSEVPGHRPTWEAYRYRQLVALTFVTIPQWVNQVNQHAVDHYTEHALADLARILHDKNITHWRFDGRREAIPSIPLPIN